MAKTENLHKDHRKRLKGRFLDEGLDNFTDHNILELLLFYSIPRKDTNPTAHELMNKFGSLSNVFDASVSDLITINGITENSAVLLKLIPKLARAYLLDKDTRYPIFSSSEKIGKYLVNFYIGEKNERPLALFFTNRMELIKVFPLSDGTVSASDISARKILEEGFSKKAACFALAHNHPDGDPAPSVEDIEVTERLSALFDSLGMPMVDHYIVAGSSYKAIKHAEIFLQNEN